MNNDSENKRIIKCIKCNLPKYPYVVSIEYLWEKYATKNNDKTAKSCNEVLILGNCETPTKHLSPTNDEIKKILCELNQKIKSLKDEQNRQNINARSQMSINNQVEERTINQEKLIKPSANKDTAVTKRRPQTRMRSKSTIFQTSTSQITSISKTECQKTHSETKTSPFSRIIQRKHISEDQQKTNKSTKCRLPIYKCQHSYTTRSILAQKHKLDSKQMPAIYVPPFRNSETSSSLIQRSSRMHSLSKLHTPSHKVKGKKEPVNPILKSKIKPTVVEKGCNKSCKIYRTSVTDDSRIIEHRSNIDKKAGRSHTTSLSSQRTSEIQSTNLSQRGNLIIDNSVPCKKTYNLRIKSTSPCKEISFKSSKVLSITRKTVKTTKSSSNDIWDYEDDDDNCPKIILKKQKSTHPSSSSTSQRQLNIPKSKVHQSKSQMSFKTKDVTISFRTKRKHASLGSTYEFKKPFDSPTLPNVRNTLTYVDSKSQSTSSEKSKNFQSKKSAESSESKQMKCKSIKIPTSTKAHFLKSSGSKSTNSKSTSKKSKESNRSSTKYKTVLPKVTPNEINLETASMSAEHCLDEPLDLTFKPKPLTSSQATVPKTDPLIDIQTEPLDLTTHHRNRNSRPYNQQSHTSTSKNAENKEGEK